MWLYVTVSGADTLSTCFAAQISDCMHLATSTLGWGDMAIKPVKNALCLQCVGSEAANNRVVP